MGDLLERFVTPALVGLLVSVWYGRISDARKAHRDHLTKVFEQAREDVRKAVEAALDYFAQAPRDRTALQEAKVLGGDRELRAAIPLLIADLRGSECAALAEAADDAFQELLAELTGGNFQALEGEVDKDGIRRLAIASAKMRSALVRLRDAQLLKPVDEDFLMASGRLLAKKWREHNPFRLDR